MHEQIVIEIVTILTNRIFNPKIITQINKIFININKYFSKKKVIFLPNDKSLGLNC